MKPRDAIGTRAAALGSMAADLKDNQDTLLSYARSLESTVSDRTAELAYQKDGLDVGVAERITQLNAAHDELRNEAAEFMAVQKVPKPS